MSGLATEQGAYDGPGRRTDGLDQQQGKNAPRDLKRSFAAVIGSRRRVANPVHRHEWNGEQVVSYWVPTGPSTSQSAISTC